ncbi:Interferon- developmental regulator 1, partial [Coemansia biformis]
MSRRGQGGSGLLRTALNSGRTRSGNGRSSQQHTPRPSQSVTSSRGPSVAGSRDVSDDELADDTASIASDDTWLLDAEDSDEAGGVSDNWEEELEEALEALDDKRIATREKGLQTAIRLMSHVYMGDELEGRRVTLLDALRRAARRTKGDQERELALRAIGLWFVNFGTESEGEEEFASTSDLLQALATDVSVSSAVRAGALGTLGMANFVSGADYRAAAELSRFMHDKVLLGALDEHTIDVARQTFETIGLLLTVVMDSDARLGDELFEEMFDTHMRGLTVDSVDVRVAAARNFALAHEALSSEHANDATEYAFERQDELVGVLEMLKNESSKRQGKRGTVTQRAAVRDVLNTIEEGEAPKLKLLVHGHPVVFDDWSRIQRLQAFRGLLGGGLLV